MLAGKADAQLLKADLESMKHELLAAMAQMEARQSRQMLVFVGLTLAGIAIAASVILGALA